MRLFIIIVFLGLSLNSCKKSNSEKTEKPISGPKPTQVEGVIAEYKSIDESIRLPGSIIPAEQISIHPEISGIVKQILFKDGQFVQKNSLLLTLNDDDLRMKLQKLKIQEEFLHITEMRQAELLKALAIGKSEYDNSLMEYRNVQSDIRIAETELKKYSIRAAFSGVLDFRGVSPGAYINTSTVISTLTQINPLKLKFSVPEQYTQRFKLKQKVNFICESQNLELTATISSMSPYLTEENKSLEVLAIVDKTSKQLRPGSFATVHLNLEHKPNSLFIPSQSIIPRIKDKQVAIYRSGKVIFSTITLGYRDSSRVEIISGINKGDTILTTGLMRLKPGMSIELSKLIEN
ncbi:MAG: efflux RND transporter periplasmic adaptor subunit [Saprospiraceae bacterium]